MFPFGGFPFEVLGAGNRGAFSIILRLYENEVDYVCRGSIIGFKVAIHLAGDLPSILSSNHFIRGGEKKVEEFYFLCNALIHYCFALFSVPLNQETLITFQPDVMRAADSLQSYSPSARGCYYSNEGTLKYFKEYTQRNCELGVYSLVSTPKHSAY